MLQFNARPEPIEVDLLQSAVIVVDMQNAFASNNGMLDLAGADISTAPQVIEAVAQLLKSARQAGIPVIFLQMGYCADLSDSAEDRPRPTGIRNSAFE
jgi:ureidoacrylate peracid hydrolase